MRSAPGCSGSRATRRWTSCAAAAGWWGLVSDLPDEAIAPQDGPEVTLRRTAVRTALDGLTTRERELVALKFHAGLSNGEIAKVLGQSETGVGTTLYRTMQKLREACDAR